MAERSRFGLPLAAYRKLPKDCAYSATVTARYIYVLNFFVASGNARNIRECLAVSRNIRHSFAVWDCGGQRGMRLATPNCWKSQAVASTKLLGEYPHPKQQ